MHGIGGQSVVCLEKPSLDPAGPVLEIPVDQTAGGRIAVTDFESQIANGTAHPAALAQHPFPVLIEEAEDSLDGICSVSFYGVHYGRAEIAERKFEYRQEKLILAFEEMVEAPRIDTRFADDGGDAGGMKALFVEELKRGTEDAFLSFRFGRRWRLSGHSSIVERTLKFVKYYFQS